MAKSEDLAAIITGCKKGQPQCFSKLIDIYARRCYGFFYRLTGNRTTSDDLLSELFVRLVEKIGSFNGGSFDGWLFKTASNIFTDYLRDRQRQEKKFQAQKNRFQSEQKQGRDHENEQIDELQMQLRRLDAGTRKLIMMRFYSQLSFKEIAKIRREPIGTTLSKVHRGLKKLRDLMEQQPYE